MLIEKDHRKWPRHELESPQIGILATEDQGYEAGTTLINPSLYLYVDLLNKSATGAFLKLEKSLGQGDARYTRLFSGVSPGGGFFDPNLQRSRIRPPAGDHSSGYKIGQPFRKAGQPDQNS